ncbi:hypothetical protein COU91_03830 [Candidatus Saccharibacteria bacterium CG10_big_fil_rev_8_21_14_0_10_47_8]|nr:MAG: hypothetical protein COU91_03830 [Candidatus Saccharibacteria bacterium CG10_big_fil_rev_8_21_14_0_10_47_8]
MTPSECINSAFTRKLLIILSSIIFGSIFWLISAKPVAAISNQSPDAGSSTVNGNSATPWHAVGTGAFDGATSYVKVYVSGNQGATVTIKQNCNIDVGNPGVQFALDALDKNESYGLNAAPVGYLAPSGTCADRTIGIPATDGNGNPPAGGMHSVIPGHEAYRVFYLEATISPGPSDNERSYRVAVSEPACSNGGNCVGISRVVKGFGKAAVFGIYQRDAPGLGGQMWNFNQPFAPRCKDPNGVYRFGVYDADYNQYPPQDLNLVMARATRGTGNWNGFTSWTGAQLGGDHVYNTLSFNADNAYIYRMQWSGINWHNTLQINVPFDELDAKVSTAECNPPNSGVVCNAANASINPVIVNQNSQFTVNIINNSSSALDNSYSLRQTYYSNINPTHQTLTRSLASGPGLLGPGKNGNFSFGISRAAPGTFTFEFQMQQNGNLLGTFNPRCQIVLQVNPDTPPTRPSCYIHTTSIPPPANNVNNATVPYGGGITLYPQIGNSTGKDWGSNYYVDEVNAGGASLRTLWPTGTVNATNDPNNAPYSAQHPVSYNNLTATTTFYYEVWIHAGAQNGPTPFPNPPANFQGNRLLCQFTVYVTPDNPVGNWIPGNPNCRDMAGQARWASGRPANIRLRITLMAGTGGPTYQREWDHNPNQMMYGVWPAGFNWRPFVDWPGPGLPAHLDQYTVYVEGLNTQNGWVMIAGPATFGNCLTATCSVGAGSNSPEPGEPVSNDNIRITYTNNTGYPLYGYGFHIDWSSGISVNPGTRDYSGVVNPPTTSMGPGTAIITANTDGTINGVATYNGAQQPSLAQCQSTIRPATRPYLKVFGGDVSAGGWFNDGNTSCSADPNRQIDPNGGIRTFASANVPGHTYRSGSSSEFAAFALGLIDNQNGSRYGFYSWSQGNVVKPAASIVPFDTLEFANTPNDGQLGFSTGAPNTATDSCIKDNHSNVNSSGGTPFTTDLNGVPGNINSSGPGGANTNRIFRRTSNLSINSLGGAPWKFQQNERLTIYVFGDVYINTDILYPNSVLHPSYFSLIVSGNIYIGSGVTTLEGLYIAQPNTTRGIASTGNIWTCAVASGGILKSPDSAETATNCKEKLTINGAVIAKHVTFNRVGGKGDLRNNSLYWTLSSDPETSTVTGGSNKSVEEINYIPEMVIGSPFLTTNGSNSRLDAVTVLPPLF